MHDEAISITSLSSTGEGVGSLGQLKVFVEGALPGERVIAEITEQKKTYAKGRLKTLIEPSPERTDPICPYFGECGGCQVMHLDYPAQLALKRKRLIDAFERIGKFSFPSVHPCLPSPSSLGYRNKIQLPVIWDHQKKIMGLYKKRSHEIIAIERCAIQCPQGEEILTTLLHKLSTVAVRYVLIRTALFNDESLVLFVTDGTSSHELQELGKELMEKHPFLKGVLENINTRKDNRILGTSFRTLRGRPYIVETLLGKQFKLSAPSFFQVNTAQAEQLYERAIECAKIKSSETVLDAFCGIGTLSLLAADHAKHVFGVEIIAPAVENAIENAQLNHISNCTFTCGYVEKLIHKFDTDVVILNPPRKGCDPAVLKALLEKRPSRIVYISCDPATLARDLALLSARYQIQLVQPIDMFPQTMHVETLTLCTLR